MSQDIEFVQLTLKVDGELCNVLLTSDAKKLLVSMLPGFFLKIKQSMFTNYQMM
jgi:hypothetical protein